jgi:spore coat polysaccharide biosynthesis protein SpsF
MEVTAMIIALIQTRMHSTRFPGKCMKLLHGKPMTSYLIEAGIKSKLIDYIGIIYPKKDYIFKDKYFRKCFCYGGPEEDVLKRYFDASNYLKLQMDKEIDHIIRLTADCPLLEFYSEIIDKTIEMHLKTNADFTHNRSKAGYPSGLDVEIMKYSVLKYIHKVAKDKEDREHVTLYIKKNPESFTIKTKRLTGFIPHFNCKWSVDTKEDFERVSDMINIIKMERGLL